MSTSAVIKSNLLLRDAIEDFILFLHKSNVIQLAIATVIGINVTELSKGFVDTLIVPILDAVLSLFELKNLDQFRLYFLGVHFKIGSLTIILLKTFMTVVFLYFFIFYLPKVFIYAFS